MGILTDYISYCVLVSLGTRNDQNGVFHRTGASGRDVAADDGREGTMEGLAIFLGVFIRLLIPLVVLLLVGESVRRISHDPLIM